MWWSRCQRNKNFGLECSSTHGSSQCQWKRWTFFVGKLISRALYTQSRKLVDRLRCANDTQHLKRTNSSQVSAFTKSAPKTAHWMVDGLRKVHTTTTTTTRKWLSQCVCVYYVHCTRQTCSSQIDLYWKRRSLTKINSFSLLIMFIPVFFFYLTLVAFFSSPFFNYFMQIIFLWFFVLKLLPSQRHLILLLFPHFGDVIKRYWHVWCLTFDAARPMLYISKALYDYWNDTLLHFSRRREKKTWDEKNSHDTKVWYSSKRLPFLQPKKFKYCSLKLYTSF